MSQQVSAALSLAPAVCFEQIRKRNGGVVSFDAKKITDAILNAARATGEFGRSEARRLAIRVLSLVQTMIEHPVSEVEEIQDLVEVVLLASPHKKTAKAYILYREQHAPIRKMTREADVKIIDQYLGHLDWKIAENSSMSYSLQGLNHYISGEISKIYWLNAIYPRRARRLGLEGQVMLKVLISASG